MGSLRRYQHPETIRPNYHTESSSYHENAPEDYDSNNLHGWRVTAKSLRQRGKDDDDELQAVHFLAANLYIVLLAIV